MKVEMADMMPLALEDWCDRAEAHVLTADCIRKELLT